MAKENPKPTRKTSILDLYRREQEVVAVDGPCVILFKESRGGVAKISVVAPRDVDIERNTTFEDAVEDLENSL